LCEAAAEEIGAAIVHEYIEYGGTGPIAARPAIRQMLGDVGRLLGIRYVLVASLDRLARKPADAAAIQEAVQAAGASLISADTLPRTYLCDPHEAAIGFTMTDTEPQPKGGTW
jgi:DNA invertase Pin-like site-specific DNA recombinase